MNTLRRQIRELAEQLRQSTPAAPPNFTDEELRFLDAMSAKITLNPDESLNFDALTDDELLAVERVYAAADARRPTA